MTPPNPPGPAPAISPNAFCYGVNLSLGNTGLDKEFIPVHYFERAAIVNRAYFLSLFTSSPEANAIEIKLSYVTVAPDASISSPGADGTYTDLASKAVSGGIAAADGILHEIIGPLDDAVEVPAGSLVGIEIPVANAAIPLEVLLDGFAQIAGYFKGNN
jgi:hypothetical protein